MPPPSGGHVARAQHPAVAGLRVDEPFERHMLLCRVVQMHIVQQYRGPAVIEFGWLVDAGVHPAHPGGLHPVGLTHSAQHMGFSRGGAAPQIGLQRTTGIDRSLLHMLQSLRVGAAKKVGQRGAGAQADVQNQLLHT